mgnify:CR=1 FL=1
MADEKDQHPSGARNSAPRSRIIETLTPEKIAPYRYRWQCRDCSRGDGTHAIEWVQGGADVHVRTTGHTVDITDEEATE